MLYPTFDPLQDFGEQFILEKLINHFPNNVTVHLTCKICYANVSQTLNVCRSCKCIFEKDTVGTRKQSSSSKEFSHYTSH